MPLQTVSHNHSLRWHRHRARSIRREYSGRMLREHGGTKLVYLSLEATNFVRKFNNATNTRKVYAFFLRQTLDLSEPRNIGVRVAPTPAFSAFGFDQAQAVILPKSLGMHIRKFRSHRDNKPGLVGHVTHQSLRGDSSLFALSLFDLQVP